MKTLKPLTIVLTLSLLSTGCNFYKAPHEWRPIPHEWHAWEPTVSLDQQVAIAPKCPGWNYSIDVYVPPEGEPDFGCATAANLAFMVARPSDLIQGRGIGMGDGARNDLYIDNYRKGKITKIEKGEKIITTK